MPRKTICTVAALTILVGLLLTGCAGLLGKQPIAGYYFEASRNPALAVDAVGVVDRRSDPRNVWVVVPPGTNRSGLVASFDIPEGIAVYVIRGGNRILQINGSTVNDFTRPVEYVVIDDKENEVFYRVTVREAETEATLDEISLVGAGNAYLEPQFDPEVKDYGISLPYAVNPLEFRITGTSAYANVDVAGQRYNSRGSVVRAQLEAGGGSVTEIVIDIVSEDGSNRERYRIVATRGENQAPTASVGEEKTLVVQGEVLAVSAAESVDPDGFPLVYEWDFDADPDGQVFSVDAVGAEVEWVFEEPGTYQVGLRVTDDGGIEAFDVLTVTMDFRKYTDAGDFLIGKWYNSRVMLASGEIKEYTPETSALKYEFEPTMVKANIKLFGAAVPTITQGYNLDAATQTVYWGSSNGTPQQWTFEIVDDVTYRVVEYRDTDTENYQVGGDSNITWREYRYLVE